MAKLLGVNIDDEKQQEERRKRKEEFEKKEADRGNYSTGGWETTERAWPVGGFVA